MRARNIDRGSAGAERPAISKHVPTRSDSHPEGTARRAAVVPAAGAGRGDRAQAVHRACLEALEGRRLLSFSPAAAYPVAAAGWGVIAGKFNGDTQADLVVGAEVLPGRADGTFGPAANANAGGGYRVAGDFNNDGTDDLASAGIDYVGVALGDGGGAFRAPIGTSTEFTATSTVAGDVNADGKIDLVVSGYDTWGGCYPGYAGEYCNSYWSAVVHVMIGVGDGTFTSRGSTMLPGSTPAAGSAVLADFNGDGRPDLAHALNGAGAPFAVAIGSSTGGFSDPQPVGAGEGDGWGIAVGDLDGDGRQDVVTTGPAGMSVRRGNGDGTFLAPRVFGPAGAFGAMKTADFNGDRKLDVATGAGVLLGNGDGTLRAAMPYDTGGTMTTGFIVGDFNRDGRPDLAAADYAASRVAVLLNDGNWPAVDVPAISVGNATVAEGNTGTATAAFTVSLSAATNQPVTVSYATTDGTATAGGDYQPTSGTLSFPAGVTSQVVSVTVNGDRLAESGESFSLLLSGASANAYVSDGRGTGTIVDDEPTASIESNYYEPAVSAPEGNAGTTPFNFTVRLSAAYDAPITVGYATADPTADGEYWEGVATPGADYAAGPGMVTFAAGQTSATITVLVTGDRLAEPTEHFALELRDSAGVHTGSDRAVAAILDDEPTVSIGAYHGAEGNAGTTPFTFTVTLASPYSEPFTVGYATSDLQGWNDAAATAGVDYAAASGALTFAAGETSKTLTVLVNGDRTAEQTEHFAVILDSSTAAAHFSSSWALGAVLDDEPRVSVTGGNLVEGNSGTKALAFAVTLSAASDLPVTVTYATGDGSATAADYQTASGTVTFAAGETGKPVTVQVKGDRLGEPDEEFFVRLGSATNAAVGGGTASGRILDDEPRVSVNSVSLTEGSSGTRVMMFTATLSHAYDQGVSVNYATRDGTATVAGSDYAAKSGALTFAAGETSKTFTVTILGDKKKESDEYFSVLLSGPSANATLLPSYEVGRGGILNDDGPAR